MLVDILGPAAFAIAVSSGSCAAPPLPQVALSIVKQPERIDGTRSVDQLTTMTENSYKVPGFEGAKTHGVAHYPFKISSRTRYEGSKNTRTKGACVWLKHVTIDIRIDPIIFIQRDAKPGSCRYNAILEHELKHMKVDDSVIAKHAPMIKRAIEAALRRPVSIGEIPEAQIPNAQQRLSAPVQRALQSAMEDLRVERERLQKHVDTAEEYRRVGAACR